MCGIAGFVGPGDRADLERMTNALAHRGPDGAGFYCQPDLGLFLGHRRLSIIDVAGGAQPMWNSDETIGVVFNGEIYNHLELRKLLEARGYRFHTDHSDTEVLIHGYAEWGDDLPARLNGMFAFCLYDRRQKRLFLARDRFGEKPLHFATQGRSFLFASELNAIAGHSHFVPRLKQRSLQKYLAYGYVPAPNSILEDCEKLPGGWALSYDIATGQLRRRRYWQFRLEQDDALLRRPESELVEELRQHLFQAVKRRLISDVPLGFFLSGGIDSSAVLAGAARELPPEQLKCFTIGFTEPTFDETGPARTVAEAFGAQHAVEWLELDKARDLAPAVLRVGIAPHVSRGDEPLH